MQDGAPGGDQAAEGQTDERPFEDLIGRLEQIVDALEQGELPLEQALEMFEEGVRLSKEASRRLDDAERRIEELLADGSTAVLDTKEGA